MTAKLGVLSDRLGVGRRLYSSGELAVKILMLDDFDPEIGFASAWIHDGSSDLGASRHTGVHVILRGSFELSQRRDRVSLELGSGDIVLVGASSKNADPERRWSLSCVSSGSGLGPGEVLSALREPAPATRASRPDPPALVHLKARDVRREEGLSAILTLLRTELGKAPAARSRIAETLIAPLFAYVLRCWEQAGTNVRTSLDARVRRALDAMRARPGQHWTVESLAKVAGLSRAAFARRFLAEVGVPPLRYLADHRMDIAARLLAESDDSLAGVAAVVGYDSEFAFSRAFKRHHGEPPGGFRRRIRASVGPVGLGSLRAAA